MYQGEEFIFTQATCEVTEVKKSQKTREYREDDSQDHPGADEEAKCYHVARWFATARPSGEVPFKNLKGNRKNMFLQTKPISADRGKACSEWFGKKLRLLLCVMKENPCEH